MTNDPLEARIEGLLGCSRAAGPRRILGLGEAPLDAAILEAAFSTRVRAVKASTETPPIKNAAMTRLEAAVAALRPSVQGTERPKRPVRPGSEGIGSPSSPIASTAGDETPIMDSPENAERRIPPKRPVRPGSVPPPPEGPIAGTSRPIRPAPRITAEHLTPFDRLVLSILVAGGGWNGRTRVLVAGLAHQAGLDATALRRVVTGLAGFMRQEGVTGTLEEMSRTERMPLAPTPPPVPGRLEAAMQRMSDGVGREFRGETVASRRRLVALFLLVAFVFVATIVIAVTAPSPDVRVIEERRLADAEARELARASRDADLDPEHVVVPSVREGMVRPTQWSRPPMFRGAPVPGRLVLEINELPSIKDDLARLARDLELDPIRPSEARLAQWDHAIGTFAEVWPLLDPGQRAAAVDVFLDVLRQAEPPETANRLVASLDLSSVATVSDPLDSWRRAFRAGLLGVVVLDETVPESVRSVGRRMIQLKLPGSNGRHTRGGPFAALAGRSLDATAEALVSFAGVADDQTVADSWERWMDAQEVIRRGGDLQQARLLAIGRLLAEGRALAGGGMAGDVLGRLVDEVDWSAAGPDPESVRDAYRSWFLDPSIPAESTWVLASLLDGPRGIGWYRPDFIPDPDLGLDGRNAALARAASVWPDAMVTAANGEIVAVDPALLAAIDRLIPEIRGRIEGATSPTDRLQALLAAERLALATTLLVDARNREAAAAIELVSGQVFSGESGIDLDPQSTPRAKPRDGVWAEEFARTRRDQETRAALIDTLRSESIAGDLGPLDAAVLAREIWRGRGGVRGTARAVTLDMFSRGPIIAATLLDTVDLASTSSETIEFIERYTGASLPELSSGRLEAAMRLAMARHAAVLIDPSIEVVERLVRKIGETIHERAIVRRSSDGADTSGPAVRWDGRPENAAMLTTDAMRRNASGLFLAIGSESTLDAIDRRRAARRRLASDDILLLVAAHAAELDYLAFTLEARVPGRRREIMTTLDESVARRATASSGLEQAGLGALGVVELERVRMVPRDGDPLGGFG